MNQTFIFFILWWKQASMRKFSIQIKKNVSSKETSVEPSSIIMSIRGDDVFLMIKPSCCILSKRPERRSDC